MVAPRALALSTSEILLFLNLIWFREEEKFLLGPKLEATRALVECLSLGPKLEEKFILGPQIGCHIQSKLEIDLRSEPEENILAIVEGFANSPSPNLRPSLKNVFFELIETSSKIENLNLCQI